MNVQDAKRQLEAAGLGTVAVEPSAVQQSPYSYVYVYLTEALEDGPHVIVSDAEEYGDPGVLVGYHAHYEEDGKTLTVPDLPAAVEKARELIRTELGNACPECGEADPYGGVDGCKVHRAAAAERGDLDAVLGVAVAAVDPEVRMVGYTEDTDGALRIYSVSCGIPPGQYHPDSEEFERVARDPAVRTALRRMTDAGYGTDHLRISS